MNYLKIFAAIFSSIYLGILPVSFSQNLEIKKLEPTLLPNYFWENIGSNLSYGSGKYCGLTPSLDSLVELNLVDGSKRIILTSLPTKQYKCVGGAYPINRHGNFLMEPSYGEIYKIKSNRLVRNISILNSLNNKVSEDYYNGKMIIPYNYNNVGSRYHYVFGLACQDSLTLNYKHAFMKYPAFGFFDFTTETIRYYGTIPDTFSFTRKVFYLSSIVHDDTLENQILVSGSNSLDITAYSTKGVVLRKSILPDSVRRRFLMYDNNQKFQKVVMSSSEKAHHIKFANLRTCYTNISITRINTDFIGLQVKSKEKCVYLVYNNQLEYVGQIQLNDKKYDFMYYKDKISYFGRSLDDEREKYELLPIVLTLKP